ncbi:MAG: aminoglycoside phosphotransferase family protein [Trueperaceae bacterium]|nr:aminoglycoside phosphotransferase family protein [Trueperaceae bacterium]
MRLEPSLIRLVTERFGPPTGVRFCGWDHAESLVWEVRTDEQHLFVKQHRRVRKFRQELEVYRDWLPRLSPPFARQVPRLLYAQETPVALLILSAVPGRLAQDVALSTARDLDLYRRAGAFLRRLHDLPYRDDDPVPLSSATQQRAASWLRRSAPYLDRATLADLDDFFATAPAVDLPRVPCHRDYSPRNWLVDLYEDSFDFAVIDFEHSRSDAWLVDLVKLWDGPWIRHPAREDAFFEGYGRTLTERERHQFGVFTALHAVATIGWSAQHHDAAYERHGREVLARWQAERR